MFRRETQLHWKIKQDSNEHLRYEVTSTVQERAP